MFNRLSHFLGLDDFDKRHKVGFVLLVLVIIGVVVLWVFQLKRDISDPLYAGFKNNNSAQSGQSNQASLEQELRAKDTDGDGLSDWDELYVYGTSPYMVDTDGDGISDYDEIIAGTDPLCAEGQVCTPLSSDIQREQLTTFSNPALMELSNSGSGQNLLSPGQAPTASPGSSPSGSSGQNSGTSNLTQEERNALLEIFGDVSDPSILRQMLLQAGMKQAELEALSDQEIMETFNSLLNP
ncbi:MAG: thrombospondin type 3 repeat-containing protein [Patescibacteria group bacterium]|nr:MAG: thrombospondin type 3 repeat-containing protein [Patescibacteria group bacterium]